MIHHFLRMTSRMAGMSLPVGLAAILSMAEASASAPKLQDVARLQQQARAAGFPAMTLEQARQLYRRSDITAEEFRQRLVEQGLDPGLADVYLPLLEGGGEPEDPPLTQDMLQVLRQVGLLTAAEGTAAPGTGDRAAVAAEEPDVVSTGIRDLGADLEIFGSRVFRGVRRDPVLAAPPGEAYVLGPGDRLALYLTGDVEEMHQLEVTREGTTFIPQVGQMVVTGLTLAEFDRRLGGRLRAVYSGVGRDPEARTRYSVSLGRIRTIQVYVTGAVYAPGSYVVSSLASLLDVMYMASGPTPQGSFRHVRLVRSNEDVEVDLYPYLTSGRLDANPRLREGDVVHVPWASQQVSIRGMIRNPAIYEMRDGEGMADLVEFAGGVLPAARMDFASVDRVLPPREREPSTDRVRLGVQLDDVLSGRESFRIASGDRVEIWRVQDIVRRQIVAQGAFWAPGVYEWKLGLTVRGLVEMAGGLRPDALSSEILIARENLEAGGVRNRLRVDLTNPSMDLPLAENDEVTAFSKTILRASDSVEIYGAVANPGRYLFVAGQTPGDLVLQAGGFLPTAMPWRAEIARRSTVRQTADPADLSEIMQSDIRSSVAYTGYGGQAIDPPEGYIGTELTLQPGDIVNVRERTGATNFASVVLVGQFANEGMYVLQSRDERLTSVVSRAGGMTSPLISDIQLVRETVTVGVNFENAIAEPGGIDDPILQDGDSLIAWSFRNTVRIIGNVVFPTEVTFRANLSVKEAISEAGGVLALGDRDRISVSYPDGSRATTDKFLGLFRSDPHLVPGAVVFVPEKLEQDGEGFPWGQLSSVMLAVASTVATVVLAVNSGSN